MMCMPPPAPNCRVQSKARLGTVVHKKTATALAVTAVKNEDQREFAKLVESCKVGGNEWAWASGGQQGQRLHARQGSASGKC